MTFRKSDEHRSGDALYNLDSTAMPTVTFLEAGIFADEALGWEKYLTARPVMRSATWERLGDA